MCANVRWNCLDYNEEQLMEVEALESIYMDDFKSKVFPILYNKKKKPTLKGWICDSDCRNQ